MAENSLTVTWNDNSNREAGFYLERKTGVGAFAQVASLDANLNPEPSATEYADSGLLEGTAYTYRVRSFNAGGESDYSNEATGTTWPAAPSSLLATDISSTEIDLAWTNNSAGATAILIERKLGAGSFSQIDSVAPGLTSYADTGLSPSSTYTYRIRATNAGGNSDYSNESAAMTTAGGGLDLTDLLYNHAADSIVGEVDGNLLATWVDNTPNAYDYFQSTGGQKFTYKTGIQNGLPVVRATTTNRVMTAFAAIPRPRASLTYYVALNYLPAAAQRFAWAFAGSNGGMSLEVCEPSNNIAAFVSGNPFIEGPAAVSGWQVLTFVLDLANSRFRIYRNGVQVYEQTGLVDDLSSDQGWLIGAAATNKGILADYGEDALYDGAHDDSQVTANAAVLQTKWL